MKTVIVSGAIALSLLSGTAYAGDAPAAAPPAMPDLLAPLVPFTTATDAAFLGIMTPVMSPLATAFPTPAAPAAAAPAPKKHHRHKKHKA